jgi:urease accessory protein
LSEEANVLARVPADTEIFAGNRARGRLALTVAATAGESRRQTVHEAGSLRVRFPNAASRGALDAVIVNTAGGMTGGDCYDIEVSVGAGARLTVTTAAAEKVYRSLGPDTDVNVRLEAGPDAILTWLPQETILFDQVRLRRTIDVDLSPGAGLILAEAVVFGRSAMGETVMQGRFSDRWRVRAGGKLIFAETLRLDGAIAQQLERRAVAAGGCAIANVLKFPGDDAAAAAIGEAAKNFAGEVGVSSWNGLMLARLVAADGASLHGDLIEVLSALSKAPLPRLWLN